MFHRRGIEGLLPFLYVNMTGTLDDVKSNLRMKVIYGFFKIQLPQHCKHKFDDDVYLCTAVGFPAGGNGE